MKLLGSSTKLFLRPFLEPKAMMFGLTLGFSVSAYVIWYHEHQRLAARGAFLVCDHFYPPLHLLLLPLAALALWRGRLWSYLVASLLAGRLIYLLGYRWLFLFATCHDEPILSGLTLKRGLFLLPQVPRDTIGLIFAIFIFIYTVASIGRYLFQHRFQIVSILKRSMSFR